MLISTVQAEKLRSTDACIELEKKIVPTYRCHLTDADDLIRAIEHLDCGDDAAALLGAERLLAASSHQMVELWQSDRLVAKWGGTAADDNSDIEERGAVAVVLPRLRPHSSC